MIEIYLNIRGFVFYNVDYLRLKSRKELLKFAFILYIVFIL